MNLQDKTVLFLGSSVTFGSASGGVSFVELLEKPCGYRYIKEAVSGTTLVDNGEKSYVARLRAIAPDTKVDLFVCQLSINDATRGLPLADIEGAIRTVVEYVKDTFGCPIAFYTGTYYAQPHYEKMVELLLCLQGEYGFAVLDLYHDAEMRAVCAEDYARYMRDPIHPTLLGYTEWWAPKFKEFFAAL